jgi:predicted site-specific integrase-resolvase
MDVPSGKKFLKSNDASKFFGVSQNTVRKWADQGIIDVIRSDTSTGIGYGHRTYDVNSYKKNTQARKQNSIVHMQQPDTRVIKGVCYCRVSSSHQKDDLKRQVEYMRSNYPTYDVITDTGSGINFKRAGFLKLIKRAIDGNLTHVVVAHKDRLVRFGFELLEWLFAEYKVSLVVLNQQNFKTPEQELTDDLLSIVHVFSCRANGRRKYKSNTNVQLADEIQDESESIRSDNSTNQSNDSDMEHSSKQTITIVPDKRKQYTKKILHQAN